METRTRGLPGFLRRLALAAGEGAFAGWGAAAAYGGWEIFLQQDLRYAFYRLAAERFASATLEGAVAGSLLSLLLFLVLEALRRTGRRALVVGTVVLGVLYLVLLALAGGPGRETAFPHHRFGGNLLGLAIFVILAFVLAALLAWRIAASWVAPGRPAGGAPGMAAPVGSMLTLLSLAFVWILPRLPLAPGATGRNLILVSVDTLRADRVGVYGCRRPLTPRFDVLAREGMVFEQATAAAPWTLPSHAALFTSLLPFTSGARNEHRYLSPGLATLAEHLKNAGYRTAGFTGGGYVAAGMGFAQGFDLYQDHDETREGGPGSIASAALAWIRSVRGRPFFAFVHTYAPHFPYRHAEFTDPGSPAYGRIFELKDLDDVRHHGRVLTPEEKRQIRDLYDGGVACADRVLGGMLDALRADGVLDGSILVILSDHGEDLWDHDQVLSPGHGHSLYQEMLLVPLIVRAPGLVAPGRRVRTPVSLLDLLPTLRDLMGLASSAPEEGRSLGRALRTGEEPEPVPILSEGVEYGPDRFARRDGNLKVIVAPTPDLNLAQTAVTARPLEIFDLSTDPGERTSLPALSIPAGAACAGSLWKRVAAVYGPARDAPDSSRIPRELREQLRSLGYIR